MKFNTTLEQYWHETLRICDKGICFIRFMQLYLQVALYYASCFTNLWKWREFMFLYKDLEDHNIDIDLMTQTTYSICWAIQSRFHQKLVAINRFLNYNILDTYQCFPLYYSEETKQKKILFKSVAKSQNYVFEGQVGINNFILKQPSKIYSYMFDLLLSVIVVRAKTVKTVKGLSKIEFEVLNNQVA